MIYFPKKDYFYSFLSPQPLYRATEGKMNNPFSPPEEKHTRRHSLSMLPSTCFIGALIVPLSIGDCFARVRFSSHLLHHHRLAGRSAFHMQIVIVYNRRKGVFLPNCIIFANRRRERRETKLRTSRFKPVKTI